MSAPPTSPRTFWSTQMEDSQAEWVDMVMRRLHTVEGEVADLREQNTALKAANADLAQRCGILEGGPLCGGLAHQLPYHSEIIFCALIRTGQNIRQVGLKIDLGVEEDDFTESIVLAFVDELTPLPLFAPLSLLLTDP